ncbi:lysosomal alpha-mannosidase isoform X2 [Frankliniella occidentalis]|uniref:Alpha-mannosidase n=1 Tax=Frankliniella occidentalis TaxID=133901 RepID=A0A6J1RZA0_FRAOC|nr:lysosomal alpha-mannosidase isoform X2 [Frankliniella occidentalis]
MELLRLAVFAVLALAACVHGRPHAEKAPVCGYESCPKPKPGVLNVHLVPHTHDDVGWLKTVDQYYYGSQSLTQKAGVQYIIDSVVNELLHDPSKRFIYVETAFFWKWWKNQHDTRRHQVKKLVDSGRLEFIGGAWSMNDEAVTNYMSIIDQFSWGLRKLNETFGQCARPRVGWQIDPFGHSREQASLFAQMGYDGLFFGRLDYQDKLHRLGAKNGEMIWKGSANLGKQAELFTGVLYNTYSPPPGFCFDVLCADEPIIDDKKSPDYNLETKAADFLSFAKAQAQFYSSGNVILTMGGDFTYQAAHFWYQNMDKLIRYINNHKTEEKVNLFYSTPSCYLKAVHDSNNTWTTKDDDFFPYASDPHAYWTGYYSSRPTIKFFERQGNNFLQVCKNLYALADLGPEDMADLDAMREAMGVMQHHDAITGTEKQHVAADYSRLLARGFEECGIATKAALNKLIRKNTVPVYDVGSSSSESEDRSESVVLVGADARRAVAAREGDDDLVPFQSCLLLNQSMCDVSEKNDKFVVTIFNPQSHKMSQFVRIPVPNASGYSVRCPMGHEEASQVVPIPEAVLRMPGRVMSAARYELVFKADNLPPMGFRSFYVSHEGKKEHHREPVAAEGDDALSVSNEHVHVELDPETGLVRHIRAGGVNVSLEQNFFYYEGMSGNNEEFRNRSSGAYIFRPNGTAFPVADKATVKSYKGDLVQEVHQVYNEWVSQVIRLYANEKHVEFEWMVGPIPVDDSIGKEVISRFTAKGLNTQGVFYTDSNGREMLKRQRNQRPSWKLMLAEPVAGNYYPVTSKISVRDPAKKLSLAVLVDRAQGGSSLGDGEIELMVHRRLLHDDAFGVGEALNEEAFGKGLVARGTHYVLGGADGEAVGRRSLAGQERMLAFKKLVQPWTFFTTVDKDMSFDKWQKTYNMEFSGLKKSLPHNVHILTLEPWKAKTLLLRLEHFVEKGEDHELSKVATVNVEDMLSPFKILRIRETTLGANHWLKDSERLKWKSESNAIDEEEETVHVQEETDFNVQLKPMQIRTFVIDINN